MKPEKHLAKDEVRYLGHNSCMAVLSKRPNEISRAYIHHELKKDYSSEIAILTKFKKNIQFVNEMDLEKLTDSTHHQGICIIAKALPLLDEDALINSLPNHSGPILFLDGIGNPHNLGAILRTAAHFGLQFVCIPAGTIPRVSPAAHRTSEGGAEFVSIVLIKKPIFFEKLKRKGYRTYGLDVSEDTKNIYSTELNKKSLFVMGSEVHGISSDVLPYLDSILRIPGTGCVESLNVSVATALVLGECFRQNLNK